jgi:hypothetical protein
MSNRNLIILAIILVTLGLVIAIGTSGVLNKKDTNNDLTINQALQKASDQALNGQDTKKSAIGVLQKAIQTNDNLKKPTPTPGVNEYGANTLALDTFDANVLSKFKVDTLVDGSTVYALSREDITGNKWTRYFPVDSDKNRCKNTCALIKTAKEYVIPDLNIYYLSSFKKDTQTYWIGFIKTSDGYTYAQISDPYFAKAKTVYFTGEYIKKINQKEQSSSIYSFDIDGQKPITVDFKGKM